ncbi:hypothetical protein PORY_002219 [Pneumocystis oryctolagi]|uniref:Uncharacterized protein n=1 Tax=Pneumocystis oryctolagi TaxID=42067 RepID=A0ACB7C9W2_9ASCO|nr:hypothetical protein PORY_002219 [Pneumocystis oryctolagi]
MIRFTSRKKTKYLIAKCTRKAALKSIKVIKMNDFEDVKGSYPFRKDQIELLAQFLGKKKMAQIPSLIVHGYPFTGKTSVLRAVLTSLEANFAWIDCKDCFSLRILLERTIYQLKKLIAPNIPFESLNSDDLTTFTVTIQNIFLKANWTNNVILIFDHIEQLHYFKVSVPIIVLLKLSELSFIPWITTVLITTSLDNITWGSYHVPIIYFPPYSKSEFLKIMCIYEKSLTLLSDTLKFEKENVIANTDYINLWQKFCGILWDTFGSVIEGDFDLFFSISKKMWPIFIKPIEEGKANKKDIIKLYKFSQKTPALSSSKIILEELSILTYYDTPKSLKNTDIIDFSWISKHLTIASYLASYNSPSLDFNLFSKYKSSTKKRKKTKKSTSTMANQKLTGPKSFTLERMLAIFLAIQSDEDVLTSDIYNEIEILASLKILIRTSLTSDKLDSTSRWKVNIGWDFAQEIAKSINFGLEDYLID